MRLTLLGVGRLKAGLERDLAGRYLDRAVAAGRSLGLAIEARDIDESRARRPDDRKREEAAALESILAGTVTRVALDETGRSFDSAGFAALIGHARDRGQGGMAVIIGGADGLDPAFRRAADHLVAFGAMTWPHQLVRVMAAEQIYRAVTILANHPYHRA